MNDLHLENNIAPVSDDFKEATLRIVRDMRTDEHGPPLESRKRDEHQTSYSDASGDALGWHSNYGDPKPLEELVASWEWLFGYEAALVMIYSLWRCGPPIIMEDQTLDMWNN